MAEHQEKKTDFTCKSIQLLKDQNLGIGSYGAVCKAKCDDLLCAAKILHPTLLDTTGKLKFSPQQEHRLPIKRFEQECEFLSTIRHPNIVQYLCMHQDPDTGLPVLLMELMDESLTNFLESSPQPIAYHIQANICHDITLALSFLHSNGIIHRDLSSNNVLLIGNIRAKVTDFGMAKLGDLNPQATHYNFTMCPGANVYMPPEAVQDEPVYSERIDCFSFGVIVVQILTQLFPKPGNRRQKVDQINVPGLPQGTVEVRIAEIDRRQNHISLVDPNHPLLSVALDCLKDEDIERPSAQQLCERVASLKERPEYSDSVVAAQQKIQQLKQQLLQQQQSSTREREEKEIQLGQMRRQLALHGEEIEQITRARDKREKQLNQQLEICQQERTKLEKRVHELEEQLLRWKEQPHVSLLLDKVDKGDSIKLMWRRGRKAPFSSKRWCDAVIDGDRVYFLDDNSHLWTYNISNKDWSQLSDAPYAVSTLVILHGLPTTIGGFPLTNKLMSLTVERKWQEKFQLMPTRRCFVTAVCTGAVLIVAGGYDGKKELTTVEVLNTERHQWSTAIDLPEPMQYHSATVCGDRLYMLGGAHDHEPTESVYTCSVSALLQTCTLSEEDTSTNSHSGGTGVWSTAANLPVTGSTCVTFCGQLLAIGGEESNKKPTTAVYMYKPPTNSWDVIAHTSTARFKLFAAVLPNNRLMLVGGQINNKTSTDTVEFGSVC